MSITGQRGRSDMAIKLSTLKRIFSEFTNSTDITLNLSRSDPTDDQIRAHYNYPFGDSSPLTYEERQNLREDWITFRRIIREAESSNMVFTQFAVLNDSESPGRSSTDGT